MSDRISTEDQQLVEELYVSLRRFASIVASWDTDPDDVLQEALTRVLARRGLSSLDDPVAYLRKAMLNLVRDEHRHARSQARAMVTIGITDPVTDTYPSDLDGLRELTPHGRAALFMAEVEGYSYSEIGTALGCSEVAARMAALRARRRMRGRLVSEVSDER